MSSQQETSKNVSKNTFFFYCKLCGKLVLKKLHVSKYIPKQKKLLLKKVYKLFILWCSKTKINLITMRYFTNSLIILNIFAELSKV